MPKSTKAARILVIDDEALVRETMLDILSHGGHRVTLADNGKEGISLFREEDYDIVFTDLAMPGLTGLDVARAIKGHRSQATVIVMTGWGADIQQSVMERDGVDAVLSKPFGVDHLSGLVRRFSATER